jgi:hypothetical protein
VRPGERRPSPPPPNRTRHHTPRPLVHRQPAHPPQTRAQLLASGANANSGRHCANPAAWLQAGIKKLPAGGASCPGKIGGGLDEVKELGQRHSLSLTPARPRRRRCGDLLLGVSVTRVELSTYCV